MPSSRFVDDAQIIELYKQGYSQKDIKERYNLSISYVRSVIKSAGYSTQTFRRLDSGIINVVTLLISKGAQYKDIEQICDISAYATDDIVQRFGYLHVSKKARLAGGMPKPTKTTLLTDEFIPCYRAGESFCRLCERLCMDDEAILSAFCLLKPKDIELHKENLHDLIIKDGEAGFSSTAIAKKHKISMSIARKIISG